VEKVLQKVMCNISHISDAYCKTLVWDSGRISNERTKKQLQKTSCFSWRAILQDWCSNGSKCQKIFALTGFSFPSVKSFTMPGNETYKTMAKLRVIQHLSSRLGHRNLLLQLVSRISSWWISWLEFVEFVCEHSSHSGNTTKSKWHDDIDPLAVYEVNFMTVWSLSCIYCTLDYRSHVFWRNKALSVSQFWHRSWDT